MKTKKHLNFLVAAVCAMSVTSYATSPYPVADSSPRSKLTDSAFLNELRGAYDLVHEKNIKMGCTNLPPTVKITVRSLDLLVGTAIGGRTCYGNILGIDRVQRAWRLTKEGPKAEAIETLLVTKLRGHALVLSDFPDYANRLKKVLPSHCKGDWASAESKTERPAVYFETKGITVIPSTKADHPCWPSVFYSYKDVEHLLLPTLKSAVLK